VPRVDDRRITSGINESRARLNAVPLDVFSCILFSFEPGCHPAAP
jgi:hypothetical protein